MRQNRSHAQDGLAIKTMYRLKREMLEENLEEYSDQDKESSNLNRLFKILMQIIDKVMPQRINLILLERIVSNLILGNHLSELTRHSTKHTTPKKKSTITTFKTTK